MRKYVLKFLNTLFGNPSTADKDHASEDRRKVRPTQDTVQHVEEISLTVEGLPEHISNSQKSEIYQVLIRTTLSRLPNRAYDKGEKIYEGNAQLNIEGRPYNIKYSLDATKVITALHIYKEAHDSVLAGANAGVYDEEMAHMTADFLKAAAWQEVETYEAKRKQGDRSKEEKESKTRRSLGNREKDKDITDKNEGGNFDG